MTTVSLKTDYEMNMGDVPYDVYPRPMLKRDSWMNLNGVWDFSVENNGDLSFCGQILVPFVPESRISGVMRTIKKDDNLIYKKRFFLENAFMKGRLLFHVGACDQEATVFINDNEVCRHVGGYTPFSADITEFVRLDQENEIKIIARDPMDIELPYGKQTSKRGGMWYTKISGIWQTVWLESVPEKYIEKLEITPDLNGVDIYVHGGEEEKVLSLNGREYAFKGDHFRLDVDSPLHWTPENPNLYRFSLSCGEDKLESYFALRTIGVVEVDGKSLLALNGKPYFFHGVLDQGYFPDGIFLPASPKGYEEDILTMKSCGFNMLRKHIKLESELFYYYCDIHGMAVFQDFINNGKYSFVLDTALPTIGLKKGIKHRLSQRARTYFEQTSADIVDILYNHPSVLYYTIFNEGWGQHDADEYYKKFKSLDPTRIYDSTSGWFKEKLSDVESHHVYFKPVKLKPVKGKPMVLSEFGGYSYKVPDHSFNLDKNYGYKTFKSAESLSDGIISLYKNEIMPAINQGLCAAVYTQLSDVEDETNGILTYDRRRIKPSQGALVEMREEMLRLFKTLYGGKE